MKKIEDTYKVLNEREHILKRPGMYIGSINPHTADEYVFDIATNTMSVESVTYIPGLVKIFTEILDNSIDEHIRNPSVLNTIKINIDDVGNIEIYDNGGIPVKKHAEHGLYVPELIFTQFRSGSNFNDEEDQSLIGTNGIGSSLCVVFSKQFHVETCDGSHKFQQTYTDGMSSKTVPKITKTTTHHTKIAFTPSYEYFGLTTLDEGNYKKIVKSIIDKAGCNPNVSFFFNDEKIKIKSFKDYVGVYTPTFIFESNNNWDVAITSAANGYDQVSFVNSVETKEGGTHVDYITNVIIGKLRDLFKVKHKVDVKPTDIKQHLRIFVSSTINRPKFDSQTKTRLISEVKEFKTTFQITDKLITSISKSPIIQDILDWVAMKEAALQRAELKKLNKDASNSSLSRIEKFTDATEKHDRSKTMCFITEGDSAKSAVQSARDPKTMGVFPLKGKPVNVEGIELRKLIENEEFKNLITIMGLQIGEPVKSIKDLYFGKICLLADQDVDGTHVTGLVINMLHKFWPELFTLGLVYKFQTPLIRVTIANQILSFYNEDEFHTWEQKNKTKKYTKKYYKGLGTSTSADFKEYFSKMDIHLIQLKIVDDEDTQSIKLAFSKDLNSANRRKVWLNLEDHS